MFFEASRQSSSGGESINPTSEWGYKDNFTVWAGTYSMFNGYPRYGSGGNPVFRHVGQRNSTVFFDGHAALCRPEDMNKVINWYYKK
jgi:hypothetical protein